MTTLAIAILGKRRQIEQQESPTICGAVGNATSLIPQRLSSIIIAIACSEIVHA